MIDQLPEYGIELSEALTPKTLVTLRGIYEGKVESLRGKQEAAEAEGESLLKQILAIVSTKENLEQVAQVLAILRDVLWSAVEENEQLSPLFVEMLQSMTTEMRSERDFQKDRIERAMKPTARPADADFVEAHADAKKLADLIRAMFVILKDSLPKGDDKFSEAFPLKERTRDGGDGKRIGTGEFLPKLSKLPDVPGSEVSSVAKPSANRQLRFSWNGEEIPAGTKVADVAHDFVSDGKTGFLVDVRGIQDALKKSEQNMFGDEPWKLEFPTGVLVGWLPAAPKKDAAKK